MQTMALFSALRRGHAHGGDRRFDRRRRRMSGRVGPAHPAPALRSALFLVQATPGAVFLRAGDGVAQALRPNRAADAHGLCLALADFPLRLPLTVGAEEQKDLLASARGGILP